MIASAFKMIHPLFRRRRMAQFLATFYPGSEHRILDVGGYPDFWNGSGVIARITVLNINPISADGLPPNMYVVQGDGTALNYRDKSFDIVFSNSVIEHLGTFEKQQRFAKECMRVGDRLWIQTPAKTFFIEPHFLTPFIHFFPKAWQRRMLRNFTVWGWLTRPSDKQVEHALNEIRLLTLTEMKQLFGRCEIRKEKFLGLTKSFIAVRERTEGS
jgi:Methyltransferase domain